MSPEAAFLLGFPCGFIAGIIAGFVIAYQEEKVQKMEKKHSNVGIGNSNLHFMETDKLHIIRPNVISLTSSLTTGHTKESFEKLPDADLEVVSQWCSEIQAQRQQKTSPKMQYCCTKRNNGFVAMIKNLISKFDKEKNNES